MVNKYSEELFGAIDEIIRIRLQSVNKDTTILCTVEDTTDAEAGKYIVSNNALRFEAYSANTDYTKGQNVWVLIPNGDYNTTKIIMGKHIGSTEETFLPYVDPLREFVDITENVVTISDNQYELIANGEQVQVWFNNGENILNTSDNQDLLKGLKKILISGNFKTDFGKEIPKAGHYGIMIFLNTTTSKIELQFDSANMNGNIYEFNNENGSSQSALWDYDEEEDGEIVSITGYFYQNANFKTENDLDYPKANLPNLFLNDLEIHFGYSASDMSTTKAFLNTRDSLTYKYNVNNPNSLLRTIYPRLVYKLADDTYKVINSSEDLWDLRDSDYDGNYPRMHLYEQKLSSGGVDARAKEQTTEIQIPENTSIVYKEQTINVQDFYYTVTLDKTVNTDRFKWIFSFKNDKLFTAQKEIQMINDAINQSENKPTGFRKISEDEEFGIQLALDALTLDLYDETQIANFHARYIMELGDETDPEATTRTKLIYALLNAAKEAYCIDEYVELATAKSIYLNYLKSCVAYFKYDTEDLDRNFDQSKSRLEINYVANTLIFTNEQQVTDSIADLIYNLTLSAVDAQHGVYNIYKNLETANGELINSKDEFVKRDLIATFGFVDTEDENTVKYPAQVYWLIPKNNTMIKKPEDGVTFGENHYKRLILSQTDYDGILAETGNTSTTNGTGIFIQETNGEYVQIYKDLDDGTKARIGRDGPLFTWNNSTKFYSKTVEEEMDLTAINNITEDENLKAILLSRYNDFHIIKEDQDRENQTIQGRTNKQASIGYQIKGIYNPSALNNRIYAIVYRANKILEANIDLQFGVKGTNELGYTLLISPIEERTGPTDDASKYNEVNAWTLGETYSITFTHQLYDNNNELVDPINYYFDTFGIKATYGSDDYFAVNSNDEILMSNFSYSGIPAGVVLECIVRYRGYKIIGNYILPVRTNRNYDYIEGPNTIIYDSNCTNPQTYSYSYGLFNKSGEAIENIAIELINTNNDVAGYEPEVENTDGENKIIPKLGYLNSGINYSCYVIIGEKEERQETVNNEVITKIGVKADNVYWYQPIFINAINNKDESVIKWSDDLVLDANVLQSLNEKPVSSVLSAGGLEQGKFTGVIIGDFPEKGENNINYVKTGIIGLKKDEKIFSLLNDGTAFFADSAGKKLISIDANNGPNNDNYYIQSQDWNGSNTGIYINLKEGKIKGPIEGTVTGNAGTATQWAAAQKVYVTLGTASTTTTIQGGNSNAETIGVDGTLGVANGGTGKTALTGNNSLRAALGFGTNTGALAIANGGTGATDAATARTNLGIVNKNATWVAVHETQSSTSPIIGYVEIPKYLSYN